jgi:hypothetical protein
MSHPFPDLASSLDHARAVADAVLYEGYLLYPYRATSSKNQIRWQFGVLGPPEASERGIGEPATMQSEFLIRTQSTGSSTRDVRLTAQLRFLQRQTRAVEQATGDKFVPVPELTVGPARWLTWDEAVEQEIVLGPWSLDEMAAGRREMVAQEGGADVEVLRDPRGEVSGRLIRRRHDLMARVSVHTTEVAEDCWKVSLGIENVAAVPADQDAAIADSFIGTHVVIVAEGASFLSAANPPADMVDATAQLEQHRCWPVLAGPATQSEILLVTPIIVEDHAEVAPQSAGALFDSTEIDEILTLRVMTLTDEEKAEARATDPKAAEIIDRCDQMTPQQLQDLHGILRNPHGVVEPTSSWPDPSGASATESFELPDHLVFSSETPWWDPATDASVSPGTDSVVIDGVPISAGSIVRVSPNRRADAQDLFYGGMTARVTAVLNDVDGDTHVAVVLVDDPAAELHDWYGRYLYFAPDELVPLAESDSQPPIRRGDQG